MAFDRDEIRRKAALGPPASAEEYLLRVRLEAEGIPNIVVATKRPKFCAQKRRCVEPPQKGQAEEVPTWHTTEKSEACLRPNRAWQTDLLESFTSMRKYLQNWEKRKNPGKRLCLPDKEDDESWRKFCFEGTGHPPTTSLLLQLDEVTCQALFEHHVSWLVEADKPALYTHQSVWLFALLARIDMPLTPDAEASVRSLLVFCCSLRPHMNASGASQDAELLACLNTIITLTGIYFGQEETHLR